MRPSLLDPLFAPASALPGIGPKNAKLFDRLLDRPQGARVVDVLFHLPQATVDRRSRPKIRDAVPDTIVTIEARVTEHRGPPNARSRAPFKVLVEDDTGDVELVFFLANHDWVRSRLPIGATRWISGKLELWDGRRQIVHPDRVMNAEEFARLPAVEPVYGLTEGLYMRTVARAAEGALKRLPRLMEWIGEETLSRLKLPSFADALGAMHRPKKPEDVDPAGPAATRLAYDELLANQLALLLMRARMRSTPGRAHLAEGALGRRLEAALPFSLTQAQRKAIDDIRADLRAEKRMLRLLQGDVGSGKTVVALLAMADVVEAGRQAAMMAPTEILARQHYERMAPLAESAGLRIALLTGRDKASERRASLAALAEGTIDVAVGTHALFQESVAFADLGLAVVDEQHRFGVRQRLALASKGAAVDLLVMTATPIPRSLVLAYFGDMDVSALREKPPGRQPIDTRVMPIERLEEVVAGISRALRAGARAYWICPLVEESETLDVAAAEDRAAALRALFGETVGLDARQDGGPRAGRRDGALPARGDQDPGRDHGRRGRRRRARGDDHDRRARRTFRPRAIASVARARRARREPLGVSAHLQGAARRGGASPARDLARDRGRFPHRRGGPQAARRGRRARRPAGRRSGLPVRPARNPRRPPGARARGGRGRAQARREARGRGRTAACGRCSTSSNATRPRA